MTDDSRLIVPPLDAEPWPTLGPEVCDWLEDHLCYGPGGMLGEPIELIEEIRLFIYRAYEVYPRGHELAGRRRFKRVVLSRRKGVGKTEILSWLSIAEMDPTAPVRCDGFHVDRGDWVPVGRPVLDPFVPLVATTREQSEELAYGAAKKILETCAYGVENYECTDEQIVHYDAPGVIAALASAPSGRDGARTSFQGFDETHLFISERLRGAHATMLRNVPKRKDADAWSLSTTTMYAPGEDSIAEREHAYAKAMQRGHAVAGGEEESALLFDHRQASERHKIFTERGRTRVVNKKALAAAVREASGDAWPYTDLPSIAAQLQDPTADESEFRRYWLNQPRKPAKKWLSRELLERRVDADVKVADGDRVALFFDGSYNRDSTALLGATVSRRPHIFVVAAWERPHGPEGRGWRTPRNDVDQAVEDAMNRYDVVELAPDPPGWHREIEDWEATYGEAVVRFETNQPKRFGPACDDFEQAAKDGEFTIDADPEWLERLLDHFAHCTPVNRRGYTVVTKPERDSPDKIDIAVGAIGAHHRARWHHANPGASEAWVLIGGSASP